MEFAELQALREGKKTIRLDVYEKNEPAVRLYERQGYRMGIPRQVYVSRVLADIRKEER